MKTHHFLGLLSLLFCQSCYYTSPVPLSSDGANLTEKYQGTWSASDQHGGITLQLGLPPDSLGNNAIFEVTEFEKGKLSTETHPVKISTTEVAETEFWNIRADREGAGTEYLFAISDLEEDTLSIMFVQEELFALPNGTTQIFSHPDSLRNQFEVLLNEPFFFAEEDILYLSKSK